MLASLALFSSPIKASGRVHVTTERGGTGFLLAKTDRKLATSMLTAALPHFSSKNTMCKVLVGEFSIWTQPS